MKSTKQSKQYFKEYYIKNRLRLLKERKEYYENNKENRLKYQNKYNKEYAKIPSVRKRWRAYSKEYYKLNKNKILKYKKMYRQNDNRK